MSESLSHGFLKCAYVIKSTTPSLADHHKESSSLSRCPEDPSLPVDHKAKLRGSWVNMGVYVCFLKSIIVMCLGTGL